uniref:CIRCULARLY PERMUTED n=1 Tax=Paenibacillus macerans TaxID=44252 RepID=UPI0000110D63|nr:Chain A, CIRCULARLY PERMUTED [Paenibacillus macerans]
FDCAEYRSTNIYGYGLYEVSMKPAKNTGIVSSFFTYTGPAHGTQWDEIDIEFLGKDTTKVQFNYYTNGVGGHEKVISLGFDASKGFHTYAFDWQPGYIKWYVDGVLKHTATANIPSTPGKIMMNLWNGTGVDDWLGSYNGANPLYAEYDWVKYTSNQTGGSFFEPFNSYNSGTWEKADGYSNGGVFNCTWRANNVNFTNDGKLKLGLTSSAYNA